MYLNKESGFIRKTLGKCSVMFDLILCASVFGLVGIIILTMLGVYVTINAFVLGMVALGMVTSLVDSAVCRWDTIVKCFNKLKGDR